MTFFNSFLAFSALFMAMVKAWAVDLCLFLASVNASSSRDMVIVSGFPLVSVFPCSCSVFSCLSFCVFVPLAMSLLKAGKESLPYTLSV